MVAVLTFDLEDPDDRDLHMRSILVDDLCRYVHDVDNLVRAMVKEDALIGAGELAAKLHDLKTEAVLTAMEHYR